MNVPTRIFGYTEEDFAKFNLTEEERNFIRFDFQMPMDKKERKRIREMPESLYRNYLMRARAKIVNG